MKPAPRVATLEDLPAIRALIPLSVRGLNRGMYTPEQLDGSLQHVFGADTQIIRDGTYYVVEDLRGSCAGCGTSRSRTWVDAARGRPSPDGSSGIPQARLKNLTAKRGQARRKKLTAN
jgi:hypothetical protein